MALIPQPENTTESLIESVKIRSETGRPYLGMSGLNGPCARSLWYGFHWCSAKEYPVRVERIFERGHWEEHRIIRDLRSIDVECFLRDEDGNKKEITGAIGEKQEEIIGFAKHCLGHPDGRCIGLPEAPKTEHLLEFKSANDKNFKKFVSLGLKEANRTYWGQVHRYMKGLGLKRALFIVTNKNTEERYYERVRLDKEFAEELERREQHIIMSEVPLEKIGDETWHECKFCDNNLVCHHGEQPNKNCRTCDHSDIVNDGKWICSIAKEEIPLDVQRKGCGMHRYGWGLL